ncbi:MAG: ribosome small subunit-dependent GTPase A [Bacteroidota bacterium]|nr:ribosome small subunit-dependent GTPase A [Bacteroidota bacterium]
MRAVVMKCTGAWYLVKTNNSQQVKCRVQGKFRIHNIKSTSPIVVGDIVDISKGKDSWMITKLYSRKNYVLRKSVNLSKQTHVIASNLDQAILMVTVKYPITTTSFIDRFLATTSAYSIPTIIVFNKLDIYNSKEIQIQTDLEKIYSDIGYSCFSLSVLHDSLDKLISIMKKKVTLISGHSGVGKSTLINQFQPELDLATQEISNKHETGKHTTTFSMMHDMDFGGSIIDTPGIKGFGLINIGKEELGDYFIEFLAFKKECKFNNCIHVNEPECAIKRSVDNGNIAISRYANYLSMMNDDIYRKSEK